MLTFLKKIRRDLLSGGKFQRYLLYAFGEIVLVVIGILIALQIDNWNDRRLENLESLEVYKSVRQQIGEDREELLEVRKYNNERALAYKRANQIISMKETSKTDSLALFAMILAQYSDFHRDGSAYQNLATSGKLDYLKNSRITNKLQQLDMTYTYVNNLEAMHWDIIIHNLSPQLRSVVNYNTFKPVNPDRLYEVELQNIFVESIYMTAYKEDAYRRAISEIDTLLVLIDQEIAAE